jgi:hypothetical protein
MAPLPGASARAAGAMRYQAASGVQADGVVGAGSRRPAACGRDTAGARAVPGGRDTWPERPTAWERANGGVRARTVAEAGLLPRTRWFRSTSFTRSPAGFHGLDLPSNILQKNPH